MADNSSSKDNIQNNKYDFKQDKSQIEKAYKFMKLHTWCLTFCNIHSFIFFSFVLTIFLLGDGDDVPFLEL